MEILESMGASTVDEVWTVANLLGMKPQSRESAYQISLLFGNAPGWGSNLRFYMVVGPEAVYIPKVHEGYEVKS